MRKGPNPRIFLILTFLAVFGGGGMVYMQSGTLDAKRAKVNELKKKARDEKTVQAEVEQSAKDLSEASAQLSHLEQGVPDAAYIPTMLAELEKTGTSCEIAITGVRPMPKPVVKKDEKSGQSQAADKKPYQEQSIEIKGTGTYDSVMRFVQALQQFPKIVGVRSMTLTPKTDSGKDAKKDQLDIVIELKTYMFPSKDDARGAVSGTPKSVPTEPTKEAPKGTPAEAPKGKSGGTEVKQHG